MADLACPACPVCGSLPEEGGLALGMISGGTQIMCPNEDCEVFLWDGTLPDGGMAHTQIMEDVPHPDVPGGTLSRPRDATPAEIDEAIRKSRGEQ